MNPSKTADVGAIQAIGAVPTILRVVAETTGLRFVCVARVTQDSWTTCAVLDQIGFGLKPGDELEIATTICNEVRVNDTAVLIDKVSDDPDFCEHHVPKMYGFESYFSIPIYRPGGEFFGTMCGLDPLPADLKTPKVRDMLSLFADLISRQLESEKRLNESETALQYERETAELREQFIAVLGHDLRTPLSSIVTGAALLKMLSLGDRELEVVDRIERSGHRIASLIDDVMDFAHGRMGDGLSLKLEETENLGRHLQHVVTELASTHHDRIIQADIKFDDVLICDSERVAQLLSNLLLNALTHGDSSQPVRVTGHCKGGAMTIAVSNAGTPIPEETRARLFQPFWRGTGKGSANGLGLSLYIASEIARAHKGKLEVESNHEATTFTFTADLSR
jgi:signal transduction histidine kinase